ncbi:protein ENL-like [Metopolophium dirhodum]|uniref:protein ENL-like n=1 Tax=Metopolophium dirhodum TaxID=44670 RepID=UPI0029903BBC|nr:protein ENL-like [Metopolophium dirhodum]
MFVDVLRRYLLIVWNFFFGQVSTESIKDSPPSCPEDKPVVSADVVPPVEVDSNDDKIENGDDDDNDIEEIFDDEDDGEGEELDLEDEDEIEEDQDEKAVIVPKKPEEKVVTNDTPTKPSVPATKTEEVKAPVVVPKPKDEIKKPEPPKAPEEISEKPKIDIDNTKKSDTPAKLKPEFEKGEREGAAAKAAAPEKDASKSKSEFEIVEREDRDALPPKPAKTEFEVVERGTAVKPVLPPPPPPPSSSAAVVKDDPSRPSVKAGGDDKVALKPAAPEKAPTHVKFQEDDDKTAVKGRVPAADFATLEKGETAVKPPGVTTTGQNAAVGDFLSAEQAHGGQLLKSHHESIQDQQLDYSDSGEELSDDDIEIDYEDDEDDEEVVEVKPLPPVARSVYKKND